MIEATGMNERMDNSENNGIAKDLGAPEEANPKAVLIMLDQELLLPIDRSAEMNIALTLATSLPEEYMDPEFINLQTGIGVSPAFHMMIASVMDGEMLLRELAAYCYMAGRLSLAIASQP